MPALRLTGSTPTATPVTAKRSPKRKPAAAKATPKRKPAAKQAPARKQAPKRSAKLAAVQAQDNGAQTRGPKLPDGWTKRDWDTLVKQMDRARQDKEAAQAALADSQAIVNELAMDAIADGIQMSVVSEKLSLSRQRLYDLMDLYGVQTERQATNPHPNKGLTQEQIEARATRDARRATKPAAKRSAKPVAKRSPGRKPAAAAATSVKPTTKRAPARKAPARKPAARSGGRVRISGAR